MKFAMMRLYGPGVQWKGIASAGNGDIYASTYRGIYKLVSGADNLIFYASNPYPDSSPYICVSPNGDIYCAGYGSIYKQTGGVGNFTEISGTLSNWYGIFAVPSGDIYAYKAGGEVYKQTGGAGSFTLSFTIPGAGGYLYGVSITPNGDVYAFVHVDGNATFYKQTGGTGNFVQWGNVAESCSSMCSTGNGDIYACTHAGGIYKCANGADGLSIIFEPEDKSWLSIAVTPNGDIFCGEYNDYYDMFKSRIPSLVVENYLSNTSSIIGTTAIRNPATARMVNFKTSGNGNIMGEANQTVVNGVASQVTAVPSVERWFTGWTGGYTGADNPLTLANVTEDMVVTANFIGIEILTDIPDLSVPEGSTATFRVKLSSRPESNKVVAVARSSGDTSITVTGGASLTFTSANWNTYQTVTLSAAEDADAIEGSAVIALTCSGLATKTVTAYEVENDISVTITNNGYGTTTPTGVVIATVGVAKTIIAYPTTGYEFLGWDIISGTPTIAYPDSATTTVTPTESCAIEARFQAKNYYLSFDSGYGGYIQDTASQTISYGGNASPVTAISIDPTMFVFYRWSNGSTANPLTITNVSANMALTAQFNIIPGSDFIYSGGTITGYRGAGGAITIPSAYNGYAITSIASSAFAFNESITSVYFPASITSIGSGAFMNCANLAMASFAGNAPSVGGSAFSGCASGFYIRFVYSATGWTTPTWNGYPCTTTTPPPTMVTIYVDWYPNLGTTVPYSGSVVVSGAALAIQAIPTAPYRFINWTVTSGSPTITNPYAASTTVSATSNAAVRANFGV